MKNTGRVFKGLLFVVLAGLLLAGATPPLSAQATMPEDAVITSAVLWLYSVGYHGNTFYVHRITADWNEATVNWNTFNNSFAPDAVGSFTTEDGVFGWYSVPITALVQQWVDGIYPNLGVVIKRVYEGVDGIWDRFYSSEYMADPTLRPKLEISYVSPTAGPGQVVIQRPEPTPPFPTVYDASIFQQQPTSTNNGDILNCNFIRVNGILYEKYSLVRFHFDLTPPPGTTGTGTPGYWMNHPEAWPIETISIGCAVYSREEAIALMKAPVQRDMTYAMFSALVAAELNVAIGNDASCIAAYISNAHAWLCANPLGSGVRAGGRLSAWRQGEPIYSQLDDYNNGLLCAPSRDAIY